MFIVSARRVSMGFHFGARELHFAVFPHSVFGGRSVFVLFQEPWAMATPVAFPWHQTMDKMDHDVIVHDVIVIEIDREEHSTSRLSFCREWGEHNRLTS